MNCFFIFLFIFFFFKKNISQDRNCFPCW